MKKLKLFLVFTAIVLAMLLACSCTGFATAQTCVIHRDLAGDGVCDVCGSIVPIPCAECLDYDHNGRCDACGGYVDIEHEDRNHDGVCDMDECGKSLNVTHVDKNHDGICDTRTCKKPVVPVIHYDNNNNKYCDVCNKLISDGNACVDDDGDGYCDLCDLYIGVHDCVDGNNDLLCDICGGDVDSGICDCNDANYDGKCDLCGEPISGVIQLFENGKTNYQIVFPSTITGSQAMLVDRLISEVKSLGVTFNKVNESNSNATDYEIIFGVPSTRGDEYKVDPHMYGPKGYGVQIIGTKILVLCGSENSFEDAIASFKEDILGITSSTKKLTTRYISEANAVSMIQDDYDVKLINLAGKDMKGFTIAADKSNSITYSTAQALQDLLYNRTGYWFEIVPVASASNSIIIDMQAKDYAREGFYATFDNSRISFISEYPTVVQNKIIGFFTTKLNASKTSGVMDFSAADSFTDDVRFVYYQDYGAKGDGVTDDAEAIRAAHTYANQGGHMVKATKTDNGNGKTYYIGKLAKAIVVKSDVDWGKAKFYLDDTTIKPSDAERSVHIFSIATSADSITRTTAWNERIKEINKNGGIDASRFTTFGVGLGEPALLTLNNSNHKNYVRYGVNASDGAAQKEVILIDENGNLDPTTPVMHDYEYLTSVDVRPIDDEPITIQGGEFYTSPYMTDTAQAYTSYGRGIVCNRSNATFINVRHFLINEGEYDYNKHETSTDYGCPYGGFLITHYNNNVNYINCQFAAHIVYKGSNGAGMGTYDLDPGYATNVVYTECYQEDDNFFNASGQSRWGVMGSSYCKNVTFMDCKLTRFDAHNGIHNAFIINTEIKMIRVNGTGNFVMENCIMHSNNLVGLREDYGGFWDGNIILKNNTMITTRSDITLLTNTWYNHYFGYPARYASNIIIDGLNICKTKDDYAAGITVENPTITLFGSGILTGAENMAQDYLPVLDANKLQMKYSDGTPVVVANKGQATPPERVIFRNMTHCNIITPSKLQYTWFTPTEFSINEETVCTQHFDFIPDGKCDDCGQDFTPCIEHVDNNNDGRCCFCGGEVPIVCDKHIDKDLNAECDTCSEYYVCDGHVDADGDTICEECGGVLGCKDRHTDANADGYCDVCKKLIPTCTDGCVDTYNNVYYPKYKLDRHNKPDCKCDTCGADMVAKAK